MFLTINIFSVSPTPIITEDDVAESEHKNSDNDIRIKIDCNNEQVRPLPVDETSAVYDIPVVKKKPKKGVFQKFNIALTRIFFSKI